MTCAGLNTRRVPPVEEIDDFDVAELLDSGERVRPELLDVERDRRGDGVPVVVDRFSAESLT
jgi:hypothetical protein